jgi:hypothetical protein
MACNQFIASAPIVCVAQSEVRQCAEEMKRTVLFVDDIYNELLPELRRCSADGGWVCATMYPEDHDLMREAVHEVWLKCTWEHHTNFRFWVIVPEKEEVSQLRGRWDADALASWAHSNAQFLLGASAVFRRFCDNFASEFRARDLVAAVTDGFYYRVLEARPHITLLSQNDAVELFRTAAREDVFIAIFDGAEEGVTSFVARCRDSNGVSALDIAVEKDFRDAAVKLRNVGCQSEVFDFDRLIDPLFQPMFDQLLDPWKPFPFDAVTSTSIITRSGRHSVLQRLFDCRVDVSFAGRDYPLVEACHLGDHDVLHCVLDRMSATGVNSFRDAHLASEFLPRILVDAWSDEQTFNERTQWVLDRLFDAVVTDGVRCYVPLLGIQRLRGFPELMRKALECVAVELEPEVDELLLFFADFDPTNDVAMRVAEGSVMRVGSAGGDVDRAVFDLLHRMIDAGAAAEPMLRHSLHVALSRDYLALTMRVNGSTLLMRSLECRPPNVAALRTLIDSIDGLRRDRALNQIDDNGNNLLQRLVVDAVHAPDSFAEFSDLLADAVQCVIDHGIDTVVMQPRFTLSLYAMCAREDLGGICFELLASAGTPASVVQSSTMNLLALMVDRAMRSGADAHMLDDRAGALEDRLRLSLPCLSLAASYLSFADVAAFAESCVLFLFAAISDVSWMPRLVAPEHCAAVGPRCCAMESYRRRIGGVPPRPE